LGAPSQTIVTQNYGQQTKNGIDIHMSMAHHHCMAMTSKDRFNVISLFHLSNLSEIMKSFPVSLRVLTLDLNARILARHATRRLRALGCGHCSESITVHQDERSFHATS